MKLHEEIAAYYFTHFDALTPEKQFHFHSRLYLWSDYPGSREALDRLRAAWGINEYETRQGLAKLAVSPPDDNPISKSLINAIGARQPFFEKYKDIFKYNAVLSRINFLQTVYGEEYRDVLLKLFKHEEVERFRYSLMNDVEAVATLSTFAVNFLYNIGYVTGQRVDNAPRYFLDLGHKSYDRSNKEHIQLLIYLYTHCVLGASRFYYQKILEHELNDYQQMMKEVEDIMKVQFENIHLDNKFEFLVCSEIAKYKSTLTERIFDEAARSLSDNGVFLVDRHNNNPQTKRVDLNQSEHRNVLFIMSNTDRDRQRWHA